MQRTLTRYDVEADRVQVAFDVTLSSGVTVHVPTTVFVESGTTTNKQVIVEQAWTRLEPQLKAQGQAKP